MKKIIRSVRVEETVTYKDLLKDIKTILQEEKRPPPENNLNRLMSVAETASYFGVSQRTIFNWSRHKILCRVEIGNRVFFEWEKIQELINKNRIK